MYVIADGGCALVDYNIDYNVHVYYYNTVHLQHWAGGER